MSGVTSVSVLKKNLLHGNCECDLYADCTPKTLKPSEVIDDPRFERVRTAAAAFLKVALRSSTVVTVVTSHLHQQWISGAHFPFGSYPHITLPTYS